MKPVEAPKLDATAQTVERFAVIIRDANGKGELLGQIHTTQSEATKTAEFWQNHYTGGAPVTAEVVSFSIPTRGQPVQDPRDLLPLERTAQ